MDFELVSRIAASIADHDVSASRLGEWKCPTCWITGDGIDEYSVHVAREIVSDFSLEKNNRWVPYLIDGQRGDPVDSYRAGESLMAVSPVDVIRVDREYRFVSRWFNPSRET
jgi:hypothetical protein